MPVEIYNPTTRPRLSLAVAPNRRVFKEETHAALGNLEGESSATTELPLPAPSRGRFELKRLAITTVYPMGFFRSWRYEPTDAHYLVYPAPVGVMPLPGGAAVTADAVAGAGAGGDDYTGVRPYQSGESQRHVDWRAVARGQPLLVKQFFRHGQPPPVVGVRRGGAPRRPRTTPLPTVRLARRSRSVRPRVRPARARLRSGTGTGTFPFSSVPGGARAVHGRRGPQIKMTLFPSRTLAGRRRPGLRLLPTPTSQAFRLALPWLLGSLAMILSALVGEVPIWTLLVFVGCVSWRLYTERRGAPLPSMVVRTLIFLPVAFLLVHTYGTRPRADGMLAFLIALISLKILELRTSRDFTIVALLSYFMVLSAFFYNQSLAVSLYLALAIAANTVALIRCHSGGRREVWPALRLALGLGLQAMPLVILLFVVFPRVHADFFQRFNHNARGQTGMSDHMTPGSFSNLALSGELAFRARIGQRARSSPPDSSTGGGWCWRTASTPWAGAPSSAARCRRLPTRPRPAGSSRRSPSSPGANAGCSRSITP